MAGELRDRYSCWILSRSAGLHCVPAASAATWQKVQVVLKTYVIHVSLRLTQNHLVVVFYQLLQTSVAVKDTLFKDKDLSLKTKDMPYCA